MQPRFEQFDSAMLPPDDSLSAWHSFISHELTTIDLEPCGKFFARGQQVSGPFLNIAHVRTSASTIIAPGRPSRNRPRETVLIHLNIGGTTIFEQFGRRAVLGRNDIFLCRNNHPYHVITDDDFDLVAVTLSPEDMSRCGIDIDCHPAVRISGAHGPGAALAVLIRDLWINPLQAINAACWSETGSAVPNILSMAIAWEARNAGQFHTIPAKLQEFIASRLCDWSLNTQVIADNFAMSVRQVQRVFASAGTTPRQYILEARLETAARQLANSPSSITRIALECGFCDLTYFGRSFRQRFGLTPKAYRSTS